MNTQDSSVYNGSQRQKVESFIKIFPAIGIPIFFVYFIEEPVHHRDITALVITSEEIDSVWVHGFKTEKQSYCFY